MFLAPLVNAFVSTGARGGFLLASFFFLGLFSSCTSLFYQPDRVKHYPPENFGYPEPKQINFRSSDNTKLVAWYFPTSRKPVLGTFVQFHGNAQNISSHYLALAWAVKYGYNLFTFDYRGYGLSEGVPYLEGVHADAVTALELAYQKAEEDFKTQVPSPKFIVFGQSLGGAIALRAHDDFSHQKETDLIVIDSSFVSYKSVAHSALASAWQTWLFSPLAYILVSNKFAPFEALEKNTRPLLVIHDKRDPAVPFSEGKRIYDLAKSKKDFWETDNGSHIDFFSEKYPEHRKQFLDYLNSVANRDRIYPEGL